MIFVYNGILVDFMGGKILIFNLFFIDFVIRVEKVFFVFSKILD